MNRRQKLAPGMQNAFWAGTRGRLLLLVLLVVAPALLVQVAGAWSDLQQEIASRKEELARETEHARGDFETLLGETRQAFTELVAQNEMRRSNNCVQMFGALRLAYQRLAPEAVNLGLANAGGEIYCAVSPVLGQVQIGDRPHFQSAVEILDLAVGEYGLNPLSGAPVLEIAYPVLSFDGKVQTVIFASFELTWLEKWRNEVAMPPGVALTLLAPDGAVLYRAVDGRPVENVSTAREAAWYVPLRSGEAVVESADLDGARRLNTLVELEHDGQLAAYLHLGYPVEELYSRINRSLQWRLASLGLTLLVALIIAWWGAEALFLGPLRQLMEVVGRVQAGDLRARSPENYSVSELTLLARALNRMADAVFQRENARRQAQAGLQESEERFRAMFDNAAVGVAVMDLDHRLLQMNQAAARLVGYDPEEIREFDPAFLAVEDDRNLDRGLFLELAAGEREQYTVEKRYMRKDGSVFWGRVNFSAVFGPEGKPQYVIGMIEDISEEKQAAEKLAAQEAASRHMLEQRIAERTEELNRANELLRKKAADDAVAAERTRLARELHDAVTQTLFSAALIADVLPTLWEQDPDEGRRRLDELHRLARGALAEMRTLLVELRPNALLEAPLPVLLRQLAESAVGRSNLQVQVQVEGQRKLPPEVQVALYRIVQEALNNSLKHSRATQALISLRLEERVSLVVIDNGAGFDPATVTADHLGLKIMRERAEAVGAKFSLYSEPGEGVQVSVSLEC